MHKYIRSNARVCRSGDSPPLIAVASGLAKRRCRYVLRAAVAAAASARCMPRAALCVAACCALVCKLRRVNRITNHGRQQCAKSPWRFGRATVAADRSPLKLLRLCHRHRCNALRCCYVIYYILGFILPIHARCSRLQLSLLPSRRPLSSPPPTLYPLLSL